MAFPPPPPDTVVYTVDMGHGAHHRAMWDDSALIDAWDASIAHFQATHPNKSWKTEQPVVFLDEHNGDGDGDGGDGDDNDDETTRQRRQQDTSFFDSLPSLRSSVGVSTAAISSSEPEDGEAMDESDGEASLADGFTAGATDIDAGADADADADADAGLAGDAASDSDAAGLSAGTSGDSSLHADASRVPEMPPAGLLSATPGSGSGLDPNTRSGWAPASTAEPRPLAGTGSPITALPASATPCPVARSPPPSRGPVRRADASPPQPPGTPDAGARSMATVATASAGTVPAPSLAAATSRVNAPTVTAIAKTVSVSASVSASARPLSQPALPTRRPATPTAAAMEPQRRVRPSTTPASSPAPAATRHPPSQARGTSDGAHRTTLAMDAIFLRPTAASGPAACSTIPPATCRATAPSTVLAAHTAPTATDPARSRAQRRPPSSTRGRSLLDPPPEAPCATTATMAAPPSPRVRTRAPQPSRGPEGLPAALSSVSGRPAPRSGTRRGASDARPLTSAVRHGARGARRRRDVAQALMTAWYWAGYYAAQMEALDGDSDAGSDAGSDGGSDSPVAMDEDGSEAEEDATAAARLDGMANAAEAAKHPVDADADAAN
ncbi:hypothetical protein CXG81DRAFT_28645 [Caulochytrium protostelioides]|uniref:Survival Motor Neuron Gemin2-binding domain-containing protein n=1 Tax=Caulochytrium protostelioides TaxID=1555241 RepID=A0A4V1ITX1_9FUNG|nr:hypothetical protein CXG81DRAFT_28645 [Caulochytrium protostelioides]|eukprot:RKO98537.1 hypothetical protein CXG81DRAFT_28645 [Caulochytrium protostelioides]